MACCVEREIIVSAACPLNCCFGCSRKNSTDDHVKILTVDYHLNSSGPLDAQKEASRSKRLGDDAPAIKLKIPLSAASLAGKF